MEESISPETQSLAKLFTTLADIELIPWQDSSEAVGLSLLKDYPDKGLFIPVRYKDGKQDSVAMIRVWYMTADFIAAKTNNQKTVKLCVAIYKSSRYLFKHHFYNSTDESSPTEISLAESKASKQPVDLEDTSSYLFYFDEQKIYDKEKRKYVEPKELVESIYKQHLKTITNLPFQIKMGLRQVVIDAIEPSNNILKNINFYLFGKRLKSNKDFAVGIITPYSFKDLDDLVLMSEKPKILGSDFPISYQTAGTFVITFAIVFLINYYFHYDFLGIVRLINGITSSFFLAVLTAAMLLVFDRGIPYAILLVINLLIRLNWYLITMKIKA